MMLSFILRKLGYKRRASDAAPQNPITQQAAKDILENPSPVPKLAKHLAAGFGRFFSGSAGG